MQQMKRIYLTIVGLMLITLASAQSPTQVVQSYGDNLHSWSETGSLIYRNNVKNMCNGKKQAVFKDKLAHRLAIENNYGELDFYQLNSFLIWIDKKVGEHIDIRVNNIVQRSNSEVYDVSSSNRNYSYGKKQDDDLKYVSCDIKISGAFDYHGSQLIYVRNGKITKVDDFVIVTTSSGEKKIKVDLSDMMDEYQTLGANYNYGKDWPIGLSINYSYSMFMISADIGVNLDKDKLHKQSLEMTDVMNFTKTNEEYDPLFYFTVTPSFYLKYFAVGCGAGAMYMKGTKYISNSQSQTYDSSSVSYTSSSSYSTEEDSPKLKFMLRPSAKGFIPLTDEIFLSLSVGYDLVFGYKEKNGFNFGLGLQFDLDW